MHKILLIALVLVAALLALPHESEAARNWGRRKGRRMEVTCAKVRPEGICNNTRNAGFQVFDGCNVCTCGVNKGDMRCSIKSCPREDDPQAGGQSERRVRRFCAKLERKVQKKLRRYWKRTAGASSEQRWPIKCFKEHKLCRDRPGVAFFDGCNQCRCPEQPTGTGAAQCEATNTCPEFVGSRRDFKRHCRTLGASIEGGRRRGGRRRGGRRRQREEAEEPAGSGASLLQRLLSRF